MNALAPVNLTQLIDERPIGRMQIATFLLCASVAFLDGLDSQSIAIAAPFIVRELHLDKSHLGFVFSAGVFGAVLSAMLLGTLADRIGRKKVLMGSVVLFGFGTFATAYAPSYAALLMLRVLSGIGLGGAVPCFLALASEYSPRRRRAAIASLLWAAFPLGGMVGGFSNALLIRYFDWHSIFIVGGTLPILLVVVIARALPESARFLLQRDASQAAFSRLVARLDLPVGARYVVDDVQTHGVPLRRIFAEGRALPTLLLSLAFLMAFATLAVAVLWTPVLLRAQGMSAANAAVAIGFHGLGALIGMAIVGRLIERFGGARVLVPALILGAIATAATGQVGGSLVAASIALALIGVFVGLGASGAIALAVLFFPAEIRSTGVGWSMGVGRLGQVIAPIAIGSLVQHDLTAGQVMFVVGLAPAIAAMAIAAMRFSHPISAGEIDATEGDLVHH